MMDIDSFLSRFQASLIGIEKSPGASGKWIQKVLSDDDLVAAFAKNQPAFVSEAVEKKLFHACLLNCTEITNQHLDSDHEQNPVIGMFKINSVETLLKLVRSRDAFLKREVWQNFLTDVLPYLPRKLTEVISASIGSNSLFWIQSMVKANRTSGVSVAMKNGNLSSLTFLDLSYLLKLAVTKDHDQVLDKKATVENFWPGTENVTEIRPFQDEAGMKIIFELKSKFQNFSVNDWMDLAEKSSNSLDSRVTWWPKKETTDDQTPSNHQLLAAHYLYEAQEVLGRDHPELGLVFKNLARKYDKLYELDLDEMSLEDLSNELSKHELEDWKAMAYIGKIMKTESILEEFVNGRYSNVLSKHVLHLAPHILEIFQVAYKSSALASPDAEQLISDLLAICELQDGQQVVDLRLAQASNAEPPQSISGSISDEIRLFLTKVVSLEDVGDRREFWSLAVRSPWEMVKICIDEAKEDSGKAGLMAELLGEIMCDYTLNHIIKEVFSSNSEMKNLKIMITSMCGGGDKCPKFSTDLHSVLISDFVTIEEPEKDFEKLVKFLDLLEICEKAGAAAKFEEDNFTEKMTRIFHELRKKESWSVSDVDIMTRVQKYARASEPEVKPELNNNLVLKLAWCLPEEWRLLVDNNENNLLDIIEACYLICAMDSTLTDEHKDYVCHTLSSVLGENLEASTSLQVHDALCHLISVYSKSESLQHCQVGLLSKLLHDGQDPKRLLASIANLPPCESRTLSLTKLKLEIENTSKI